MSTGKQWRAAATAAGVAMAFFLTGCGGDDGPVGPVSPPSLATRSYTYSENGGPQTAVSFASSTEYAFQHANGTVEHGSYQATRDGNHYTVSLISTEGGQMLFGMTFSSASSGTYVLKRDGEPDRSGSFTVRGNAVSSGNVDTTPVTTSGANPTGQTTGGGGGTTGSTTGSTTGTSTGSTTGSSTGSSTGATTGSTTGSTTSGGGGTTGNTTGSSTGSSTGSTGGGGVVTPSDSYVGFVPTSIAGRTMLGTRTFTSTGPSGQTHIYTFGNGNFHDSDSPEEADGTYQYSPGNGSATLNLVYTGPEDFVGDTHNMTLSFTSKDRGNFDSTYTRGDGTTITINGTFQFEAIP